MFPQESFDTPERNLWAYLQDAEWRLLHADHWTSRITNVSVFPETADTVHEPGPKLFSWEAPN